MKPTSNLLLLILMILVAGCSQGPEPIRWGTDTCDRCRMVIVDRSFGAEFVEKGGRIRKFDEVDEMVRYLAERPMEGKAFVTNGLDGGLVPAEHAAYVESPDIKAPMGSHLMSFADRLVAEKFIASTKPSAVRWHTHQEVFGKGEGHEAR